MARSLVPSKKYSVMGGISGYFWSDKSSRSCIGRDWDRVQMSFFLLPTFFRSLLSRKDFKCSMQVIPSYGSVGHRPSYSVTC